MVFRIVYRCAYYPQWDHEHIRVRTPDEWDAYNFCGAVKRGTTNAYFDTRDPRVHINGNNVSAARILFGNWVIATRKAEFLEAERLVPVPSKDSWDTDEFRSLSMLRTSMPSIPQMRISPMVRFTEERQSASSGGPRGYDANYPFLMAAPVEGVTSVVLVDDIVTSGGTLLAARRRLLEAGVQVAGAIVCGRTSASLPDPWQSGFIEVPDDALHLP